MSTLNRPRRVKEYALSDGTPYYAVEEYHHNYGDDYWDKLWTGLDKNLAEEMKNIPRPPSSVYKRSV